MAEVVKKDGENIVDISVRRETPKPLAGSVPAKVAKIKAKRAKAPAAPAAANAAPSPLPTPATTYKYVKPDVSHLPLLDRSTLPNTVLMQTLGRALTMRRDHESDTEAKFVGWLVNRLPVSMIDAAGNVHVDLRSSPAHRTMFTAHTDTVHSSGGDNPVRVDGNVWRADGAALGADDGAGVALLCHMIDAGVPGLYVFFRGEERGGVGSSWLAENMRDVFADIDRAVAFDRADYYDIITDQSGGVCCSDKFAKALCDQLFEHGLMYMPDPTGVYTDTAEFTHLVSECTNVSVGYKNQHGDREEQDVAFLQQLADAVVQVKWDELPVDRDHTESRWGGRYAKYGGKSDKSETSLGRYFGTGKSSSPATRNSIDDYYEQKDLYERGLIDNEPSPFDRNPFDDYYDSLDRAAAGYQHSLKSHPAPFDDWDDEDVANIDNRTKELRTLVDAIEQCLAGGKRSALAALIAESVSPTQPEFARRNMNMGKLTDEQLAYAIDDLLTGWDEDTVLMDLFNVCSTV